MRDHHVALGFQGIQVVQLPIFPVEYCCCVIQIVVSLEGSCVINTIICRDTAQMSNLKTKRDRVETDGHTLSH